MEIFYWNTGLNYAQVLSEYYCLGGRGRVGVSLFCLFVTTMNSCSRTYKLSWLGKLISSCTQVCG